jgi:hypothetical protein
MSAQDQPNNLQKHIRCPKNMKLSKRHKTYAALGPFKSQADRNVFIRMMGIAEQEAAMKVKQAAKMAQRSEKVQPVIGAARSTVDGASVAEATPDSVV